MSAITCDFQRCFCVHFFLVLDIATFALHNHPMIRLLPYIAVTIMASMLGAAHARPESTRSAKVIQRQTPLLERDLANKDLALSSHIFIRIFKQESELGIFVKNKQSIFVLFRTYPICDWSGRPGPKTREGDNQSPEGFYFVTPQQLNPWSRFHLSFNLGYPNAYDRAHGRTGSFLMVHGNCVSIGCYAMTDPVIEEIYTLADAAFSGGQAYFRVHIFPFRMSEENLTKHEGSRWTGFWQT